jgi:ATP-binding cassette subfamily B protein RaxB
LQHDRLFQGSVADNISCFEAEPDIGRIREAACLACIWRDLQELPMSVHTPVADGGIGLSGGQVQRVLLARALYRHPRVLFLDEATSHLDRATEQTVLDNLRGLKMTIVSVAHRENALARGGRTIRLGGRENTARPDA